ncbi:MAG: hypothetical protein U5J96_07970 [Ignavibacteriaceae bacterium]|nr:hypothetical protein [Ignavibacteriaceae bacterium]
MKKPTIIILSLLASVVLIAAIFILNKESSDSVSNGLQTINKNLLVGNWLRTDSDYIIQISKVNEDFTLEANYFNPNPINVGKANWEESYGNLKIIIELRDVNYPGSTYTLNYLPDRDILAGEYFQAVEGLTFYVEFARSNQN